MHAIPKTEHHIEQYDLTRANPFYFIATQYGVHSHPAEKVWTASRWSLHYELETTVCLEGRVRRLFGQESREYGAGDIWFVGSWEPHFFRVLEIPYRTSVLIFPPEVLTDNLPPEAAGADWTWPFRAPLSRRPVVPEAHRGRVIELGERLQRCHGEGGPHRALRMRGLLFELLSLVFEWHAHAANQPAPLHADHNRLRPALELVRTEQRRVGVEEAAAACSLCRSAFTARFRNVMGVSFAQFAMRHRFGRAAEAVAEGELPIKAIARQWGFANESHLTRVFRQFLGCTPGEHRARHEATRLLEG